MKNELIKDPLWKEILNIEYGEVDEIINETIFKLLDITNMSENKINKMFKILTNYEDTQENNMRQRISLYEMRKYIEYLKEYK